MATSITSSGRNAAEPPLPAGEPIHGRLRMLDGWRAISILLVLAAHMLPLGPARWNMNKPIAANGMAIFFTLSGFLIVGILHRDTDVGTFLIRRIARVVPLAWLALLVSLPLAGADPAHWLANLFFYANLPPFRLLAWSSHYWSVDVEMQFYVAIALVVLLLGRRGLGLVPVAAIVVTLTRIASGTGVSIVTWLRVDEILSGGMLALALHSPWRARFAATLAKLPFWPVAILFLLSARPELPWLDYARPYLAATMVGITIARPVGGVSPVLESRGAAYLARISYAVYIIHHFALFGWLGSGHGVAKYVKRPISLAITFALAHCSTFYVERRFIDWSHRLGRRHGYCPQP